MWLSNNVTSTALELNEPEAPAEDGGELLFVGEGPEGAAFCDRR